MKKFLRYQLELVGTHENDLTKDFCDKLNLDYDKRRGIYNNYFGDTCEINAHCDHNTIVLCGCVLGNSQKECKAIYTLLKVEAKKTFVNCKKTNDLIIATGNKLF
jgi:hypothetical protein